MPLFALANAGVAFGKNMNLDYSLVSTIAICLVAGNFIGVAFMTFLGVKLRLTELPTGVRFKQILGIAFLAGVGFTMSIFIANLAFIDSSISIDSAKVGILIGSFISGTAGYIVLRLSSRKTVLSTDTKSN